MVTSDNSRFNTDAVALLCVEFWKLTQATKKAIERLPNGDGRRLEGQLKYSQRQLVTLLDQLGLKLIEFDGEEFHAGLSASADNAEDFADGVGLVVAKTLEPTIMEDMKVIRTGRVLVEPANSLKE
ncbi:MAG: hypothetical protein HRU33_08020 [Rhodobacteraceae bacterium]|nr:hypothetical protein [Paracoccaceae bacterium]